MFGSTVKSNTDFSEGLYFVGGSLVVSAITIIALRFVVRRRTAPLVEVME